MRTRPTKPLLSHNMQPDMLMEYRPLTDAERRVICDKATEPPFSGALLNERRTGTYLCRRCGAPLYRSDDKFDAGCGWPSFDAEIPGAVKRIPDPDGVRTEIVCARCGEPEKIAPQMLTQDYTCHKCAKALLRRQTYLNASDF